MRIDLQGEKRTRVQAAIKRTSERLYEDLKTLQAMGCTVQILQHYNPDGSLRGKEMTLRIAAGHAVRAKFGRSAKRRR